MRVWFVPILARGHLHIEVLPDDFPGDVEEGMAAFVARARAGLNAHFPTVARSSCLRIGAMASMGRAAAL